MIRQFAVGAFVSVVICVLAGASVFGFYAIGSANPADDCPTHGVYRLVAGDAGQVTPGAPNRLRTEPNLNAAILMDIPGGAQFMTIAGPYCSDGYTWWWIDYNGTRGYTADGTAATAWVEPANSAAAPAAPAIAAAPVVPAGTYGACPATQLPALKIGSLARVTKPLGDLSLYAEPTPSTPVRATLRLGEELTVVGGPVCNNDLIWWRLANTTTEGWFSGGDVNAPLQATGPGVVGAWLEPVMGPAFGSYTLSDCPAYPARLAVGGRGRIIAGQSVPLHDVPGSPGAVITTLTRTDDFTIVGGPYCSGSFRYWAVNYSADGIFDFTNGSIGWVPEGDAVSYWLEPTS